MATRTAGGIQKGNSQMVSITSVKILRLAVVATLAACVCIAMSPKMALATDTSEVTKCPVNYTCSYLSSSTQALVGGATDGQPQSRVGFLTFDGSGNFNGVLSGSLNGKVVVDTAVTGTCVSGSSTTLGQINFNAGLSGNPSSIAFVTAPHGDGLHTDLILAGSMLSNDTRAIVGTCRGD